MEKELVKKYPYIVAWGKVLGSYDYYIEDQLQVAQEDNAPHNAVYYSVDFKKWVTIDECHPDTQTDILIRVKKITETK